MDVDFWFDPICPFCWATSRWINRVAPHRDLRVTWLPISLLFKNQMTEEGNPYFAKASRSLQLLRVVEATRSSGRADRIGDLYTEFGRHIHHRDELDFDVTTVLHHVGLDTDLAAALDDDSWDEAVRASMAEGLGLAGDDVGTPLIALQVADRRVGLFGPVITEVPDVDGAIELWDGVVKVAGTPGFFELKRTRSQAPALLDEADLDEQLGR